MCTSQCVKHGGEIEIVTRVRSSIRTYCLRNMFYYRWTWQNCYFSLGSSNSVEKALLSGRGGGLFDCFSDAVGCWFALSFLTLIPFVPAR